MLFCAGQDLFAGVEVLGVDIAGAEFVAEVDRDVVRVVIIGAAATVTALFIPRVATCYWFKTRFPRTTVKFC